MIPNPPIKRKKIKNSNVWICTEEGEDLDVGAHIYTWSGGGLCYGEIFSEEIELDDDTSIYADDNGDIA